MRTADEKTGNRTKDDGQPPELNPVLPSQERAAMERQNIQVQPKPHEIGNKWKYERKPPRL